MTLLHVMPDDAPETVLLRTRDADEIAAVLREHSVELRHWQVRGPVAHRLLLPAPGRHSPRRGVRGGRPAVRTGGHHPLVRHGA